MPVLFCTSLPPTGMRFRSRSAAIPVLALTAWSLSGCYRYVPLTRAQVDTLSGRARVDLAANGTLAVRAALGDNVRAIEGPIERISPDSVYMRAEHTTTLAGVRIAMSGAPVTVARADALSINSQQHARNRSILTAVVLLGGIAVLMSAIALASSGTIDEGPVPPPTFRPPR
jgi:hypothetical protein